MNQSKIVERINERLPEILIQIRPLVAGVMISEIQILDCEKEGDPYESLESCRFRREQDELMILDLLRREAGLIYH